MAVTRWLQGRNARTHCRDIRDYFRPGGGNSYMDRRGCSSEILNLTPKGDQSGRGLGKF